MSKRKCELCGKWSRSSGCLRCAGRERPRMRLEVRDVHTGELVSSSHHPDFAAAQRAGASWHAAGYHLYCTDQTNGEVWQQGAWA